MSERKVYFEYRYPGGAWHSNTVVVTHIAAFNFLKFCVDTCDDLPLHCSTYEVKAVDRSLRGTNG